MPMNIDYGACGTAGQGCGIWAGKGHRSLVAGCYRAKAAAHIRHAPPSKHACKTCYVSTSYAVCRYPAGWPTCATSATASPTRRTPPTCPPTRGCLGPSRTAALQPPGGGPCPWLRRRRLRCAVTPSACRSTTSCSTAGSVNPDARGALPVPSKAFQGHPGGAAGQDMTRACRGLPGPFEKRCMEMGLGG